MGIFIPISVHLRISAWKPITRSSVIWRKKIPHLAGEVCHDPLIARMVKRQKQLPQWWLGMKVWKMGHLPGWWILTWFTQISRCWFQIDISYFHSLLHHQKKNDPQQTNLPSRRKYGKKTHGKFHLSWRTVANRQVHYGLLVWLGLGLSHVGGGGGSSIKSSKFLDWYFIRPSGTTN